MKTKRCSYCKADVRVYKSGKYAGRLVGHKVLSHISLNTGNFISRRCTGSLQFPWPFQLEEEG
jgi:hypothetical protein